MTSDNADDLDHPTNLSTIRPDGTGLRYLTDLRTPDQRAFAGGYAPNGKWIAYRLEQGDQNALMIERTERPGSAPGPALLLGQAAVHRLGTSGEMTRRGRTRR